MVVHGELMLARSVPFGTYPVELTHAGTVIELQPVGRTHAGAGEQCEEGGEAGMRCYELTATPILHPLCTAQ